MSRRAATWRRVLGGPPPDVPERRATGRVLLAAAGVTVLHGDRRAVDDVTLDVRAGELLALVGPNGAGKSSLLRALAGDAGSGRRTGIVELDGRPVDDWDATGAARRRAVLPQDHRVGFPFTALEVVRMGRSPWAGTPFADHDDAAVAEALALADAAHLARRAVTTLSGGERARVALARVLAQRTQLLLLDEPTAALDLHHAELALGAVGHRVAAGDGAVVVLHDLAAAAAHADRVALLDGGRLVAVGPPREVLTAPLLTEVYRHPVDVVEHPDGGPPLVVPRRTGTRPVPVTTGGPP